MSSTILEKTTSTSDYMLHHKILNCILLLSNFLNITPSISTLISYGVMTNPYLRLFFMQS